MSSGIGWGNLFGLPWLAKRCDSKYSVYHQSIRTMYMNARICRIYRKSIVSASYTYRQIRRKYSINSKVKSGPMARVAVSGDCGPINFSGPGRPGRAHEGCPSGCLRIAVPLENKNSGMACGTLLIRRAVAGPKVTVVTAFRSNYECKQ